VEKEETKETQKKKKEKTGKIQISKKFQKRIYTQDKYKIVDVSFLNEV